MYRACGEAATSGLDEGTGSGMSASNNETDEPGEQSPRKPDLVDVYVGARIRDRRIALGMSQDSLGEILGVTFQQVQKYERGVNRIAAKRLLDMCRALSVTMSYFFEGLERTIDGPGDAAATREDIEAFMASPEGQALVTAYLSIQDPRARKTVTDLLDIIAIREADRRSNRTSEV